MRRVQFEALLVHQLLQPGRPEYDQVVAAFGTDILGAEDQVDRRALGTRIFADVNLRATLNSILHPAVRREEDRRKDELRASGGGIVVTDAALLVETGRYKTYDRLVVVACDPGLQLNRLLARDRDLSAADARRRLAAQSPVEEKIALADYIIETSGSLNETERRTRAIYALLLEDLECKRCGETLPTRPGGEREN